jgi:hypothetical protein
MWREKEKMRKKKKNLGKKLTVNKKKHMYVLSYYFPFHVPLSWVIHGSSGKEMYENDPRNPGLPHTPLVPSLGIPKNRARLMKEVYCTNVTP